MANELPILKGYDTYSSTIIAQEELLYTTMKKDATHIMEHEVKMANARKNASKSMETASALVPKGEKLGEDFKKVFDGLGETNRAQDELVLVARYPAVDHAAEGHFPEPGHTTRRHQEAQGRGCPTYHRTQAPVHGPPVDDEERGPDAECAAAERVPQRQTVLRDH